MPLATTGWKVEDGVLVGRGPISRLLSERGDYEHFRLRAEVCINDKGTGGLFFRARFDLRSRDVLGYEAVINSAGGRGGRTGSLLRSDVAGHGMPVTDALVKPDTWFVYEVSAEGNHFVVKVDGKPTVDWIDQDARGDTAKGHFALQAFDADAAVKFRRIDVEELPPAR
jgi:hypothetical protein